MKLSKRINYSPDINPVRKIAEKQSEGVHFYFYISTLKMQSQIAKNTLLQTAFSAILPILFFMKKMKNS